MRKRGEGSSQGEEHVTDAAREVEIKWLWDRSHSEPGGTRVNKEGREKKNKREASKGLQDERQYGFDREGGGLPTSYTRKERGTQ